MWMVLLVVACGDDAASPDAGARDAAGRDSAAALRDAGSIDVSDLERTLIDMPADTWMRVEQGYGDVCTTTETDEWHAVSGCGGLLAFSGGLWDPDHRLMLLWGGGHADYAGNEVYAFSTRTFTWERLTEPSPGPYDRDPLDDGQPVSRHTYDGLTWLPDTHVMWAWTGSRSLDGSSTNVVWEFDPIARTWTDVTEDGTPGGAYETSATYDPYTQRIYLKSGERFLAYTPRTRTWQTPHDFGFPPLWPRYAGGQQRGVLAAERRLIFWMGGGLYMVYDIENDRFVTDEWITTGGATFTNAEAVSGHPEQMITTGGGEIIEQADPGLDYDVRADQIVGWTGEELWALDLTTKTWTARSTTGAPPPGALRPYGRFRYIDALNVFILVDSLDDVWFYKNTAGP